MTSCYYMHQQLHAYTYVPPQNSNNFQSLFPYSIHQNSFKNEVHCVFYEVQTEIFIYNIT